jgi:hypothetical protein
MEDRFPNWSQSILEYFLYEYNLSQDFDSTKYYLDVNLDSIIKDDTKETNSEQNSVEDLTGKKNNKENKK